MELIHLPNGVSLEAELNEPSRSSTGSEQERKLAVCLHPWSWLGGQMNDPVLLSLTEPLMEAGYYVLRYNSRGVGSSTGWASFTGFSEATDLQMLVKWAIDKISTISSLLLVGYSHGSLIASLHPILPEVKTSHVLISYPLSVRGWITLFRSGVYTAKLKELVQNDASNVLILYGTQDEFTGVSKYREWVETLENESKGHLEVVEIADGSHFWRGHHGRQLAEAILEWSP